MSKILTAYAKVEDVPEADRKFCALGEDGKVYHNTDGLEAANATLIREKTAIKTASDLLQAENDKLKLPKTPDPKPADDKTKPTPESALLLETREALKVLQDENAQNKAKAEVLERNQYLNLLGSEMHPNAIKSIAQNLKNDEQGDYVVDETGKEKIDLTTGLRVTHKEYINSLKGTTDHGYMFKSNPSSPNGVNGKPPDKQTSRELLLGKAEQAMKDGDVDLHLRLIRQSKHLS